MTESKIKELYSQQLEEKDKEIKDLKETVKYLENIVSFYQNEAKIPRP